MTKPKYHIQDVDGVRCKECNVCHRLLPLTEYYRNGVDRYMRRCKQCQCAYLTQWRKEVEAKKEEPELPCLYCKSYSYAGNSNRKSGYCIHHHKGVKSNDTCGFWKSNTTLKFKL